MRLLVVLLVALRVLLPGDWFVVAFLLPSISCDVSVLLRSYSMRDLTIQEIESVVGTHSGTSHGFVTGVFIGASLRFFAGGPIGAFAGAVSGGIHGAMIGHYLF
ncbi:MAG TPA: hypothetical protein ACQGQH_08420 [Xylella sp.]